MNPAIVGVGQVGLVTAAVSVDLRHCLIGLDDDADNLAALPAGGVPFAPEGVAAALPEAAPAAGLLYHGIGPGHLKRR